MSKVVRIGAATAFFNDSRMGIAQLLEKTDALDYVIFDFLAESVMGGLGRGLQQAQRQVSRPTSSMATSCRICALCSTGAFASSPTQAGLILQAAPKRCGAARQRWD